MQTTAQKSANLVAIPISKSKLWSLLLSGSPSRKNYGKPVKKRSRRGMMKLNKNGHRKNKG